MNHADPWAEHRVARRTEIISTAVTVVQEHGPDASIRQIAEAVGVSKPVLYRYFADRDALILAVRQRIVRLLVDELLRAIERPGSPREWIGRSVRAYLDAIRRSPHLYLFAMRPSSTPAAQQDPVQEQESMVAEQLSITLGRPLQRAGISSTRITVLSYSIVGMVETTANWWLCHEQPARFDDEQLLGSAPNSGIPGPRMGAVGCTVEELAEQLSGMIWQLLDGLLREHGIVVDPDEVQGRWDPEMLTGPTGPR